ncbi:RNase H domain-containing protein [Trichostrongylus colubriformis]|uniref:Ribonuclease H n=1 Tax=Trichostrongylus colubriformis TaxID=6319 RepID=A0AAN8FVJ1_TRICO
MIMLRMSKFYAVAHGFQRGIYENWDDAKKQIDDFPQAVYKKFSSREDAEEYFKARQAKKIELTFPEPNREKYYAVARGYAVGVFTDYEDVKKSIEAYPQPLHKKFDSLDEAVSYFNKFFHGKEKGENRNQKKVNSTEEAPKTKDDKGITYYAVARGHTTGVFTSWEECKKQTTGFKGAKFKKFEDEKEATMFAEGKTLKQIEEARSNRKRDAASSSGADIPEPQKKQKKHVLYPFMAKRGYYAVANGRKVGVFRSWDECHAQVNGYPNARYKKFVTESEALAFITNHQLGCTTTSFSSDSMAKGKADHRNALRKRKCGESSNASSSQVPKRLKHCDPEVWRYAPVVYTDGACSNNGKFGAKAGFGVFWGENHVDNSYGPVPGAPTNNRGELVAVDVALKQAIDKKMSTIVVRTDSKLLINSLDDYMDSWKRNSWKTSFGKDVSNQDLLQSIDKSTRQINVKFEYVPGHSGDFGNDAADALARRGAQMYGAK